VYALSDDLRTTPPHRVERSADRDLVLTSASEIVQAQSALFLLVQSAQAPDLDALESSAQRVREWLGILGDQLAGMPDMAASVELGRLHLQLSRAQRALDRFVPFRARRGAPVPGTVALREIQAANQQLRQARCGSDTFTEIMASCCAADITDIAQRRNNDQL
jgi:hypothetical protein